MTDFNSIYLKHSELVYNLSLNYLHSKEDAEEITQDVFVKVFHELSNFRGESKLKTWIYRITINACLDKIKSAQRRNKLNFLRYISDGFVSVQPLEFNHPGIQLEQKEATERILIEIQKLPEKQQTAIILKSIEGLSQKEIAEIMDLSEKAVESLLSRARAKLKLNLKKREG
ncbi:MAG: RNA polymerase sigma factor [Salibacteraceae bacterium]